MIDASYLPAMLIVAFSAFGSAWWSYRYRQDIFDPRVCVALGFAYVTLGPAIYCMITGEPPNPGLKTKHLDAVHLSVASAIFSLFCGCTIVLGGKSVNRINRRTLSQVDLITSKIVLVFLFAGIVAGCLLYAFAGFQIHGGAANGGKANWLINATQPQARLYYVSAGMLLLACIFFVVLDAVSRRQGIPWASIVVVLMHTSVCTFSAEREFVLVGAVFIGANWSIIPRKYIISAGVAIGLLMVWIAATRDSTLSKQDTIAAIAGEELPRALLASVTHISPNAHVFTNVIDIIPTDEPFWNGRSYWLAILCFMPGDYAFKEETPMLWFQQVYDRQGESGFAFSIDSEAYLNFGFVGPVGVFLVLGILLGAIYSHASRPEARPFDVYFWWYVLIMSMFAIRSDSRGFLKLLLFGTMAAFLIWGSVSSYVQATTRTVSKPLSRR